MTVNKCDKCGKTIKTEPICAGIGWHRIELCKTCGKEIIDYFVKNKLLKDELVKYKLVKIS
jgi:NAD-dependent SIR2 family protein deacetylase